MNVIILSGNLGQDAQERTNSNSTKYWTFSLATNESYKDKNGERQKITTWHNCMLYGNYENLVQYLRSGQPINIRGVQRHDSYEKGGQTQYYSYVKVQEIQLAGSKSDNKPVPEPGPEIQSQPQQQANAPASGNNPPPPGTDDLPF